MLKDEIENKINYIKRSKIKMIIKRMMVKIKIDQRDTTNFLLEVKIKRKITLIKENKNQKNEDQTGKNNTP